MSTISEISPRTEEGEVDKRKSSAEPREECKPLDDSPESKRQAARQIKTPPDSYPTYECSPKKVHSTRHKPLGAIIDAVFIVIAGILSLWLAGGLLIRTVSSESGAMTSWSTVLLMLLGWLAMAYLALPRIHQLFTLIYVPNYFIGRTKTVDGLLGDPVNLAFDGSAADIHCAMQRAGWTLADPITLGSSWRIIVSAIMRRSYPDAPVSNLYLFGRPQEFAYQQEVKGNANRRHHVRFWQVPEDWALPGGQHCGWLAAGTYDRAVGFSMFTLQVTHKIDEDIDVERDYIVDTLQYCDPEVEVEVIEEFATAYHHRNGGGDSVRTDGNLPIVDVSDISNREATTRAYSTSRSDIADAVKDVSKERRRKRDRRMPPPSLLGAGAVIVLEAALVAFLYVAVFNEGVSVADGLSPEELVLASIVPVVELFSYILTVMHFRFARIILMISGTIGAVHALGELLVSDTPVISALYAFFAVLVLLAVCGDDARDWTSKRPVKLN